ncbi:MAG: FG-GAP-like repeat-containing protein [Deltaproteobacteria bacterium]|nr:FG-GAP-like repeat-containing protein [Deltaproteobacteria bacterium]
MLPKRAFRSYIPWLLVTVGAVTGAVASRAPAPTRVTTWVPDARERIAGIRARIEVASPIAALRQQEGRVGELQRGVLAQWKAAWIARDGAAFEALLAPDATAPAWSSAPRSVRRERDGLREEAWTPASSATAREAAAWLGGIARVEHVQFDVVRMASASATTATFDLRFDLRAHTSQGGRREDRGVLRVSTRREGSAWKITAIEAPAALETLSSDASRRPSFENITRSVGLDRVTQVDRREAIRRGGYALAVSDYDGDGRADVLVGNWGPLQLFRNTGHGFEETTAAAGITAHTLVKAASFADLDGDGHQDLVLARFVDQAQRAQAEEEVFDGRNGVADFVAYRNLGNGRFERKGAVLSRSRQYDRGMPMSIADFDGDGRLDVYIGFPGGRDFTNNLARTGGRTDRAHQGLWLNQGDWRFLETAQLAQSEPANGVFPHAALATDLNGDARPDLVVVDDSGRPSTVFRNEGRGEFVESTRAMGLAVPGWGMGVSAGDYDGDGHNDLVLTHVAFAGGERAEAFLASPAAQGLAREARSEITNTAARGVTLFHNRGDGTFEDVTLRAGVPWGGAGPAGAEFIDFNNDGALDIYVTNGLWSGGEQDYESQFLLMSYDRDTRDSNLTDLGMSLPGSSGPAANPVLAMLRDFRGSLDNPRGAALSDRPTLSLGGYQRNRLFRNNNDGTFTDVGFLEGADLIEDGYQTAPVDIDGDGRQDLVVRNCDMTPGRPAAPLVVLRNTGATGRSLTVALRGAGANNKGVGAQVTATVGGRRMLREVRSVNGAIQTDPAVFFGLGAAERVEGLQVRWPSGRHERFADVTTGRVELVEGRGVAVP